MSAEWRAEQDRCLREIERHQEADKSYMDEGVQILELARNAQRLFEQLEPREKRRLLNFVLSNCAWEDGEVVATFRQPFDLLAETTAIAARSRGANSAVVSKNEIWLWTQCGANQAPLKSLFIRELIGNISKFWTALPPVWHETPWIAPVSSPTVENGTGNSIARSRESIGENKESIPTNERDRKAPGRPG